MKRNDEFFLQINELCGQYRYQWPITFGIFGQNDMNNIMRANHCTADLSKTSVLLKSMGGDFQLQNVPMDSKLRALSEPKSSPQDFDCWEIKV